MNLVATHHNCTSPMDYISHHALHPHSITPITQLSPFTHQPWLSHHTCTSFTHSHKSSTHTLTHCEVLFCPGWHSERCPCFLIPCVYLDCLFTLTVCCLPFWPCLPVDIFSVCCLPRPLNCPCCWFCLAFIIPVTAFDPCLFDILSEIKLLLDLTSLPSHYNCSINDGWLSWPRWSKTGPSHETTTSMFHRWDKILKLECSVFFSPNITASHLNQYILFWFHPSIKHFFQYSSG